MKHKTEQTGATTTATVQPFSGNAATTAAELGTKIIHLFSNEEYSNAGPENNREMIVEQNMADESEDEAYSDENGDDDLDYDGSDYSSDNETESRALEK